MTYILSINNLYIGLVFLLSAVSSQQDKILPSARPGSCPSVCNCSWTITSCTRKQLNYLPDDINVEVRVLDLSYNDFTSIPANISRFKRLERLILKHNRIRAIGWLEKLDVLSEVDLSNNRIARTSDVELLVRAAIHLKRLDLSLNNLTLDILSSASLKTLTLRNCSITLIPSNILENMVNLEVLDFSMNPIRTVPALRSNNLTNLDMSACNIETVSLNALDNLEKLKYLKLSQNFKLKSFLPSSKSILRIDLSFCNLESVPKVVMPNLTHFQLQENHIRKVDEDDFANLINVETINLSRNSIRTINKLAFRSLQYLFRLDLSYNTLISLDPTTFRSNSYLRILSLSSNYLSETPPLLSESLTKLDLAECEISEVSVNSLTGMPKLVLLNLTGNLMTRIPENLSSTSLAILDLSNCRIKSVRNNTFAKLPKLYKLILRGNRLIEMRASYLHSIGFVELSDNSWHCDCRSRHFKQLFFHLRDISSDIYDLTCQSPESLEGYLWVDACRSWFDIHTGNQDHIWKISIVTVLLFLLAYVVIRFLNRARRRRRQANAQDGPADNVLPIINVEELSEEGQPMNAPDPRDRDDRPPSYVEALTFPPLGSCTSLDSRKSTGDLARNENNRRRNNNNNSSSTSKNNKPRKKRKRRRSKSATSAVSQGDCDAECSNQSDSEVYKETEL